MTAPDTPVAEPAVGPSQRRGFGVDVGGSGLKGGIVDLDTGQLIGERFKLPTPQPSTPDAVAKTVAAVVREFGWTGSLGVTYPGVVTSGVVRTAANVDKGWIGVNAAEVISAELGGQHVTVLNDADAAGLAEERFGAGKDNSGVIVLLTFGTGIGSAVIHNGVLLPNTEFGHLEVGGKEAEHRVASSVKDRKEWSYERWTEGSEPLENAAHRADLAMYEAKSRGPNHALAFEASMQDKVAERASLETKLRTAIQQKAIRPFYQPLIDLKTGDICGFEALARWSDDTGVNIPPPVFIGIAEETGMITELFENLLSQACRDALGWHAHIVLSFNISPVQMEDRLLASRILKVLAASGLPASCLELELTETLLMEDTRHSQETIAALKALGVTIALDDFGVGYSSLSYLKQFTLDTLKVDRAFTSEMLTSAESEAIVRATFDIARALRLRTVAEGVETRPQAAFLAELGCDVLQGFYFAKPMPSEQLLAFAKAAPIHLISRPSVAPAAVA